MGQKLGNRNQQHEIKNKKMGILYPNLSIKKWHTPNGVSHF